jgi:DNA-binding response OmpR family regulator
MSGAKNTLGRVLVAEDSKAIRSSAESVLRQAGYNVFIVKNAADALEWIKANQPDAVLLDLSLPDLDGGKVCELVKSDSSLQDVYIFILLSSNEIKRVKELKALGADGFVIKPFVPKDLVDHLESVLGKGKSEIKTETSSQKEPASLPKEPHSYEWFLSEMKKETQGESPEISSSKESSPAEKDSPEENEVEYETREMSSEQDSYENFISQFKEEVKVSGSHEPLVYGELKTEGEIEPITKIKTLKEKPVVKSQNEKPKLDPERVTSELIHEVASKIAREIVESMDKEILRSLIQKKIKEFKI